LLFLSKKTCKSFVASSVVERYMRGVLWPDVFRINNTGMPCLHANVLNTSWFKGHCLNCSGYRTKQDRQSMVGKE
jgi:hypothetical protein